MGIHIYILYLCLYLLSIKSLKSSITEKDIAYGGIVSISDYTDAINKPYCVSFKIHMDRNLKTTDSSSLGIICYICPGLL